jgi:tetratricopeptide (TPR) repeat protein
LARFSAKDTTGALKDLTKAVETNPYIPDGYVNRAMVYYHQGSFEKALDDVESAIRLRPDEAFLYMNRGIIRYQLDDLRGSMSDFDKFIDLEPRNAMGYNNRGILRAEIGDLNGAINDLSRVLALREEEDLPTLYYRGMLYKEKGEFRKALSDFNIVAEAHPDFAPVYMNRAGVKQALGQDEAAQLDYNTAMKIEMDRRDKIGSSPKPGASGQGKSSNEADKKGSRKRKETREEGDKNIKNYNKIAALDDFGADKPEQLAGTSLRGKIQNRNIMVDLQPPYGITFFPGDTLVHRVRYFEKDVEELDNLFIIDRHIAIANATKEIDRAVSAQLFETISQVDKKLGNALSPEEQKVCYMERGLLYMAALNLNNAIDDFSKVINFDPENYLACFMRAYARYKMVETVREMQSENPPAAEQLEIKQNLNGAGDETLNKQTILDYNLVIDDLKKTTDINPDFEFAWFNLGYMNSLLRNFDESVKYYSRAIELNSEFAEAYFNRGLVRIFLGETSEGTFDLSKSGELGVFEAYSVIKRYGSYSVESQNDESGGRE